MTHHEFLPAAGQQWALPFYDTMTKLMGVDAARRELLEQARVTGSERILDVGCGTGTFAVFIKSVHPRADVTGLDPDEKALRRAGRKADRAAVRIAFDRGYAHELPYPDGSFDRVFSSFMFHHLPSDLRVASLQQMRRVLRAGGSLHLLDFGGPLWSARGLRGWMLRKSRHTRDNFGDLIPTAISEAGFEKVEMLRHGMVIAGPVAYYRGVSRE